MTNKFFFSLVFCSLFGNHQQQPVSTTTIATINYSAYCDNNSFLDLCEKFNEYFVIVVACKSIKQRHFIFTLKLFGYHRNYTNYNHKTQQQKKKSRTNPAEIRKKR